MGKIVFPTGVVLKFTPTVATSTDKFLLQDSSDSSIVAYTAIPANRIVAMDPFKIVVTDADGFVSTAGATDISLTEINYLNGVTSNIQVQLDSKQTASNFDPNLVIISDGSGDLDESVTTAAELAFVSGVTSSIQTQLDSKQAIITGGATSITSVDLAINRALISNASGKVAVSSVTSAELGHLSGVLAPIQLQLDTKLSAVVVGPNIGNILYYTGSTWTNFPNGSSGDVLSFNGSTIEWVSPSVNGLPVGGSTAQYLRKNSGTNYDASWHTFVTADISDITATAANIDILAGTTVTSVEFNYLSGTGSNIQDQLDTKQSRSLAYNSLWVGDGSNYATMLPPGSNDEVLTIVNNAPVWQAPSPPGDVSGPVSSTDHAIVRWNGTSGDSIQDSSVIIDDSNNVTGVVSLSTGQVSVLNQAAVRLYETGSTNYVALRASGTMAADYTITLPAAAPTSGDALTFDGADYVWSPAAGSGVTDFLSLTDVDEPDYTGHAGDLVGVNGTEDGLIFISPSGVGTVTSVSGTTNRITVTSPTTTPVIDIDAAYVGQASITTLGTVATGTWNATNISLAKGGTGAALVDPNADRIFFWDDSAGSTAFLTPGTSLAISTTTIDVANDGITDLKLRDSAGLSVIGRATNSSGDPADITAGTDHFALRRSGTSLGFGLLALDSITMNTGRILGRTTASAGKPEELIVQNGINISTAGAIRLGGALVANTAFTGGGFNWTAGAIGSHQIAADEHIFSAGTSAIRIRDDSVQHFYIGDAGGATLDLGSDATGDIYYRDGSGFLTRLPIGSSGQYLSVASSIPLWTNDVIEDVAGTTYSAVSADNGKIKHFTNVAGCTVTFPVSLPTGFSLVLYRGSGAGTITIASAGTYEGVDNTIDVEETAATVYHRGSDIHVGLGSLGASGGGGGSGTVTSVGLIGLSGILNISGSPVTTSGTMTMALANQTANTIFSGPSSGASAAPTFRTLVLADLPNETIETVSGTTYTFLETDNKKIKHFTNAAGCTITIPLGLTTGWTSVAYRGSAAGTLTFGSAGTYEGESTTLSTPTTAATVVHRGSNVHMVVGALGSAGGSGTVTSVGVSVPSFLSVSGSPVTSSGTIAISLSGTALPATSGGTGLTAYGTANQILGMNNAGTALEYKTVSVSSTAVSNNVGVTLGGANALVINIPDASVTVRGIVNTGSQTFGGNKTITGTSNNSFVVNGTWTASANNQVHAALEGTMTARNVNSDSITGYYINPTINSNSTNQVLTALRIQGTLNAGSGASSRSYSLVTTDTRFRVHASGKVEILPLIAAATIVGDVQVMQFQGTIEGGGSEMGLIKASTTLTSSSIGNTIKFIDYSGTINTQTYVSNTIYAFDWNPTLSGSTPTQYGIVIRPTAANSGFGVAAPTANVHIAAASTTKASLRLNEGVAPTSPNDGDIWHATDHIYARLNGITYQIDQQGGGGGSGTVTSFSSGNLTPLFTTSVATGTTTPALSFILSNAAANTYYGNGTGSSAAPSFTANAALTVGSSDTNITLSVGGNASTSLLKSATVSVAWAGTLAATRGGTGTATVTTGDILYGSGSNVWSKLAAAATGNVLLSGATPSWGKVALTTHVSGTLPIANGGTGLTALGSALQVLRVNSGATALEYATIFTNTAAANELAMSDGTNLDPSGVFVPSSGNLTLGSVSISGNRDIIVSSSSTNSHLSLYPQGTGNIKLGINSSGVIMVGDDAQTGDRTISVGSSSTNSNLTISSKGSGDLVLETGGVYYLGQSTNSGAIRSLLVNGSAANIALELFAKGNDGLNSSVSINDELWVYQDFAIPAYVARFGGIGNSTKVMLRATEATAVGFPHGRDIELIAGAAYTTSGNGNGGDVLIQSGLRRTAGSGVDGNITIDSLTGYLILATLPTSSAGLPTGAVWNDSGTLKVA